MIDAQRNRWTQRFLDRELESAYLEFKHPSAVAKLRIGLVLAMLLYPPFALVDPLVLPNDYRRAWWIRFAFAEPIFIAMFALSFTNFLQRHFLRIVFAFGMVMSGVIAVIYATGDEVASHLMAAGLMLIILWAYILSGLNVFHSTMICLAIVGMYTFAALVIDPTPPGVFAYYMLVFVSAITIGAIAAYVIEDYSRRNFLRSRELKIQAEELAVAREAADAANVAKSAFLANMSHELRTPMNAILGYSEMLMEEAEDAELDDFTPDLKKINDAGTHLLALINDVLDLSKIEAGKTEVFVETFDIATLIRQSAGTAAPLMDKNGNRLEILAADDLGESNQDLTKLRQSLLNLLSNAAKFTHEGTVTVAVDATQEDGFDWLHIAVKDSGIGIPEDKLEKVFEEFGQAEESTTRNYGGTGLGLPISRRFCRMLGGDLTLESEPGDGSTFTIRVPTELDDEGEPVAAQPKTHAIASEEPSSVDMTPENEGSGRHPAGDGAGSQVR